MLQILWMTSTGSVSITRAIFFPLPGTGCQNVSPTTVDALRGVADIAGDRPLAVPGELDGLPVGVAVRLAAHRHLGGRGRGCSYLWLYRVINE